MSKSKLLLFIVGHLVIFGLSACNEQPVHETTKSSSAITNRLHVPPEIISNLGITFEKVKRGKVGTWLTVPGKLNVPEEHHYTLRAPTVGRVKLLKSLWDEVKSGEPVAELISSELVSIQEELVAASNILQHAQREAHTSNSNGTLPTLKVRKEQALRTFKRKLKSLAVLTGLTEEELSHELKDGQPAWLTLATLSIRSPSLGKITELRAVTGDIVEASMVIAVVLDTSELIFKGNIPAVDLSRISSNTKTKVLPEGFQDTFISTAHVLPVTEEETLMAVVEARITNPEQRLPHGFPAVARLLLKEGSAEEAIVHPDCIVVDGLEHILFRRDPEKPEYVVRTSVELGNRSADEVEVISGVLEGDEIVRNGVHQLKQTGLGKAPAGGHFHADGTWHEGDK